MADQISLMSRRIRRILLVCNNYDNFSLEEDGRLEMRISREYSELNLSNPPVFERKETAEEALELFRAGESFDLVIIMYNSGNEDVFEFAEKAKLSSPDTPIVLLTSFNAGYISVDEFARGTDFLDFRVLDTLPATSETPFIRHIRLGEALKLCVDGRTGKALIKL